MATQKIQTLGEIEAANPMNISPIDQFMKECHAVRRRTIPEIKGLRQRARGTGITLAKMRLVAEACDVDIITDGKELKVVPLY